MHISYKKLWKLLIDREMMKKNLCELAGISSASMAKLGKNENINTDIFVVCCSVIQVILWKLKKIIMNNTRLKNIVEAFKIY